MQTHFLAYDSFNIRIKYIQYNKLVSSTYTVFEEYRPMSGSNACRHNTWHTDGVVCSARILFTVSTAGARQIAVQLAVTIDRSWQEETDVLKHL